MNGARLYLESDFKDEYGRDWTGIVPDAELRISVCRDNSILGIIWIASTYVEINSPLQYELRIKPNYLISFNGSTLISEASIYAVSFSEEISWPTSFRGKIVTAHETLTFVYTHKIQKHVPSLYEEGRIAIGEALKLNLVQYVNAIRGPLAVSTQKKIQS